MAFLKVLGIIVLVLLILFVLTLVIYFFNLDMKFASCLIRPLTAWYDWSKDRRERKAAEEKQQRSENEKKQEKQQ